MCYLLFVKVFKNLIRATEIACEADVQKKVIVFIEADYLTVILDQASYLNILMA